MKLPLDENLNPVPVVTLGPATDLTDGDVTPSAPVVRIKAITEARLWCYAHHGEPTGSGALLSENETEYIKIPSGHKITVTGTINITEVY